ncbi:hypothetical protein MKZ38_005872 [Zalerion maritima]|uniref:Aminoacyl-transfer RNA synthetases class-II family profile domain-containing protein n=1 Tax=Zalerion maritima TaxID=339359 RepID=A0AAD5RKL7_9PEZI|nr:hypothetical protein MKZ38_005872 [Zalerion maritima]
MSLLVPSRAALTCRPAELARCSLSASFPVAICRWTSSQAPVTCSATIASLFDNGRDAEGSEISVNGFVRSVRAQKQHCFVALGDGSTLAPLQALVVTDQAEGLTTGAAVRLRGSWVESPAKGQSHELHANQVEILGPSDAKACFSIPSFPIQKKYQTPEYLRTMPHLRSRTPFNSVLLRFRSEAIASLTSFFASRQFIQTHPPIITSSDCEGAGEVFTVSGGSKTRSQTIAEGDQHQQAESETTSATPPSGSHGPSTTSVATRTEEGDFFRSPKYLTVSSQLHLEAFAQSVGNVWTLSPTFRAEKSDTSRHLAEFYMLEAEMSFVDDVEAVMSLTENMLKHLTRTIFPTRVGQELVQRSKHSQTSDMTPAEVVESRWKGMMHDGRWPRIAYTEAVKMLRDAYLSGNAKFRHEPVWGRGLHSEHEKFIASKVGREYQPVFITNYPRDIKAFYMRQTPASAGDNARNSTIGATEAAPNAGTGTTVDCFDLLVPEYCEIAGGSMREHRLSELLSAMEYHGLVTPARPRSSGTGPGSGDIPLPAATGLESEMGADCPLGWLASFGLLEPKFDNDGATTSRVAQQSEGQISIEKVHCISHALRKSIPDVPAHGRIVVSLELPSFAWLQSIWDFAATGACFRLCLTTGCIADADMPCFRRPRTHSGIWLPSTTGFDILRKCEGAWADDESETDLETEMTFRADSTIATTDKTELLSHTRRNNS